MPQMYKKAPNSLSTALMTSDNIKSIYRYQIGEGNGTPLQYSCLENPMDEGAW